jgi:hypothetical protein
MESMTETCTFRQLRSRRGGWDVREGYRRILRRLAYLLRHRGEEGDLRDS